MIFKITKMSIFRKFNNAHKTSILNGNYCNAILEEVSLEGLDGITFEALLQRLSHLQVSMLLKFFPSVADRG